MGGFQPDFASDLFCGNEFGKLHSIYSLLLLLFGPVVNFYFY